MLNRIDRGSSDTRPRGTRVVVVGAGMGGLTAALLLAARGLQVTVVEKADRPGGRRTGLPSDISYFFLPTHIGGHNSAGVAV